MTINTFIILNDGVKIPQFGMGLYNVTENTAEVVKTAFQNGYKMFDTAKHYKNEFELGLALKDCKIKREDYFIVTKLWRTDHGYEETKFAFKESLRKLDLGYIDLYLIHSPNGGKIIETWKAMVELKRGGFIRSIGVSNFNVHHLDKLKEACDEQNLPLPSVNQIELHPWLQQKEVVNCCRDLGIELMGFCPLVRTQKFNKCPIFKELSTRLKKTQAQVILRWAIQKRFVTIPKSSNSLRIKENAEVFDFQLNKDDMEKLDGLEEGFRVSSKSIETPWIE